MTYETLVLERDKGVTTIKLNRPDKLNALNPQMANDLANAVGTVSADDDVRVLILTGNGRGFCAGGDLTSGSRPKEVKDSHQQPLSRWGWLALALRNLPKPTIAAVNGAAIGAGLSLALLCDLRIAAAGAKFSSMFIQRGLIPDTGATFCLPQAVGASRAFELMYTGRIVDAWEAEKIGLVSKVVPDEHLMESTLELAAEIAKMPPLALKLTKLAVLKVMDGNDLEAQLIYESLAGGVAARSEDSREAVRAFLEKREPRYRGR